MSKKKKKSPSAYGRPAKQGIALKKKHGQHFLQDSSYIDRMIARVMITPQTPVFEIGCGEGVLSRAILATDCARFDIFEIDQEWAEHVQTTCGHDNRLHMHLTNVLDADLGEQRAYANNWVLLANLPYQVTFPILHMLRQHIDILSEGVIMVQEEVAQKIVKKSGRGYGYSSLFFQHYFHWELLDKVPPGAFYPPPNVMSRLLYLKPAPDRVVIPEEAAFWKFIKVCFRLPRRTLRNNLVTSHLDCTKLDEIILQKRAQQLSMQDFLQIWDQLR